MCVCSPETGGLPPVKIEKKTDKEETRKVSKSEHVGGGGGGGWGRGRGRGWRWRGEGVLMKDSVEFALFLPASQIH